MGNLYDCGTVNDWASELGSTRVRPIKRGRVGYIPLRPDRSIRVRGGASVQGSVQGLHVIPRLNFGNTETNGPHPFPRENRGPFSGKVDFRFSAENATTQKVETMKPI